MPQERATIKFRGRSTSQSTVIQITILKISGSVRNLSDYIRVLVFEEPGAAILESHPLIV